MSELDPPSIPADLREDGLLWAINRTLLHPRGFALGVVVEDGSLVLYGDGTEPWRYDPPIEPQMLRRFNALLDRAQEANRVDDQP